MMKRHMVGTGGLTVEESEKKMQEAETDEEIEEQVIYLAKTKTNKRTTKQTDEEIEDHISSKKQTNKQTTTTANKVTTR